MVKNKLKSSALLVALVMGIVLSGIVSGAAILMTENIRATNQGRDGEIAYRAALSGVEDGLLRYKYYHSKNQDSELLTGQSENSLTESGRVPLTSYILSFKMSSLVVGDPNAIQRINRLEYTSDDVNNLEKSQKAQVDDTIDIDISSYFNQSSNLSSLKIDFSQPFITKPDGNPQNLDGYFTAMNYQLIDIAASGEQQKIKEETNFVPTNNELTIQGLGSCTSSSVKCHIRFRPQVALTSSTISTDPVVSHRLDQGSNTAPGKYVYFAITATSNNQPYDKSLDKPGTIKMTAIGIAGNSRRKLVATIDSTRGVYLGIFDYGVYCGESCIFPKN